MAVVFDAKMTAGNQTTLQTADNATSNSSTGMTVGASATLLIAVAFWQRNVTLATGTACTWNGVSMTSRAAATTGALVRAEIFCLVNPATGNQTLSLTWSNACDCYLSCISFTGTDTTTGIATADSVSGSTGTTVTITSTTDGATVAIWGTDGSTPTMNFTQIFGYSALDPGAGSTYAMGGTSNGHTFTGAGGSNPCWAGVHVIAGEAAPTEFCHLPPLWQQTSDWWNHMRRKWRTKRRLRYVDLGVT